MKNEQRECLTALLVGLAPVIMKGEYGTQRDKNLGVLLFEAGLDLRCSRFWDGG